MSPVKKQNIEAFFSNKNEYKYKMPNKFMINVLKTFFELPRVTELLPNEQHFKIKVLKSDINSNQEQQQCDYIVTPRGMIGSQRTYFQDGDITIGRQNINENGIKPNDILLPNSDLSISRTHFRIIYKFGFRQRRREMPTNVFEFFKIFHNKCLKKGRQYLPKEIQQLVLSYLKEPYSFYVQDLGSIHGTYIKVNNERNCTLKRGQTYQIGVDIYLNVIDIQYPLYSENQHIETYDDFMQYIAREYASQTKIHGIEKQHFNHYLKNHNNLTLVDSDVVIPKPYSIAKVEVITSGGLSQHHLFVAQKNSQMTEFKIGRAPTCDIMIAQNTISREQCRFMFKQINEDTEDQKYEWLIQDGNEQKESSNGTWLCLTDYRLRPFKQESDWEVIQPGSEIKISDTILKVEWDF